VHAAKTVENQPKQATDEEEDEDRAHQGVELETGLFRGRGVRPPRMISLARAPS
jgi:hypothetical protein